jgi:hypothetical protein
MDALKTIITWAYNQGGLIAEGGRVNQLIRVFTIWCTRPLMPPIRASMYTGLRDNVLFSRIHWAIQPAFNIRTQASPYISTEQM